MNESPLLNECLHKEPVIFYEPGKDAILVTADVFAKASKRIVGLAIYAPQKRWNAMQATSDIRKDMVRKRESRNQSISIPRSELLAVTIGIRAQDFIKH
ncbi:Acetyl-CoA carboxylase [Dirofilaria immitis]